MPPPITSPVTSTHSAARTVAARIHEHFAGHREAARLRGEPFSAPVPDAAAIEAMIDAAFWASLRREEGYVPTISMAYLAPDASVRPLLFERPLPLAPAGLARLGPAVERPGIHLGVWRQPEGLLVWGMTWTLPALCFVLEVVAPGLLVVKHRRAEDAGKFANVLVLEGDQIKMVDERASSISDCPELLASLLGFDAPGGWTESRNLLVELAVLMRAHGRGGCLLVVPAGSSSWRESIVQPIAYPVLPSLSELSAPVPASAAGDGARHSGQALARAVAALAGLTAIDGATVINDRYEALAFGVKIGRREGRPRVEQVAATEPIEGATATIVHPAELGGTRHLSAAQFVHDQHDAVALVASQDGRFTVFAWSPCEEMVHAHRVEALLL